MSNRVESELENLVGGTNPLESPKSRVEEILMSCLNDEPITTTPQSNVESLLIEVVRERGGLDVEVQELDISENGSYTAPMGIAYSPVVVDVEPDLIEKEVTANGTYSATDDNADGYSAVVVNVPSSGGGGTSAFEGVRFIDYDGTELYSYTKDQALALTEMPANPTHTGLTAQGWNYSLASMKRNLEATGAVLVGQMYITDDGKTRIYISIPSDAPANRRIVSVRFASIGASDNVLLDWGDGTVQTTGSSTGAVTLDHTYISTGDYVITLKVNSGSIVFDGTGNSDSAGESIFGSRTYGASYKRPMIKKIEIGESVTRLGQSIFYSCYALSTITIPDSVTSIESYAFRECKSLSTIIIPDSVTSIGNYAFNSCTSLSIVALSDSVTSVGNNAFSACYSLSSVTIPDSVTSIGANGFEYCYSLSSVTIPDSVTEIGASAFSSCYSLSTVAIDDSVASIGGSAFSGCYSLSSVTIPDSVTSIASYTFSGCSSLSSVTIPDSVKSIGANAFNSCSSLSTITIPDSVTSIGSSCFGSCYSLSTITIPDSVTSIGNSSFSTCLSLPVVTIPDSVTSIGTSAFNGCYSMSECHLQSTTPPTLSGTNAFTNNASDRIFYVPYSEDHSILNAYKTATNWSTYASKMQEEPAS